MWKILGASVRGASHERSGLPCQDSHLFEVAPGGYLIAAIADGAGSACHSEKGSCLAVRAAVEALKEASLLPAVFSDSDALVAHLGEALACAHKAVTEEAANLQVPPRDLATTLTVALVGPDFVAIAQVGDGASIVKNAFGIWRTLTSPPDTEYVNETTFLTSPKAIQTAQYIVERMEINGLALMTDGLIPVAVERPDFKPFDRFLDPLFKHVADSPADGDEGRKDLEHLLESPKIRQKTDDDLTLLLAASVPTSS